MVVAQYVSNGLLRTHDAKQAGISCNWLCIHYYDTLIQTFFHVSHHNFFFKYSSIVSSSCSVSNCFISNCLCLLKPSQRSYMLVSVTSQSVATSYSS